MVLLHYIEAMYRNEKVFAKSLKLGIKPDIQKQILKKRCAVKNQLLMLYKFFVIVNFLNLCKQIAIVLLFNFPLRKVACFSTFISVFYNVFL
jgi:hypothetical protein